MCRLDWVYPCLFRRSLVLSIHHFISIPVIVNWSILLYALVGRWFCFRTYWVSLFLFKHFSLLYNNLLQLNCYQVPQKMHSYTYLMFGFLQLGSTNYTQYRSWSSVFLWSHLYECWWFEKYPATTLNSKWILDSNFWTPVLQLPIAFFG